VRLLTLPAAVTVLVLAAGCSGSTPQPSPTTSSASPASPGVTASTVATDYSQTANWLSAPRTATQAVDVFYLYPSKYRKSGDTAPNVAPITDPGMRKGAQTALAEQASAFASTANIYAPYYRQLDASYALTLPHEQNVQAIAGPPTQDGLAAFTYYLEHYNNGRPFLLAGHSQGSQVTENLLSGYLKDHPHVYRRMVAAYVIGYSVTPAYLAANPHLKFAEGADDTGVLISYNTVAPQFTGVDPVVLPGAMAINPITWTGANVNVPAAQSLGAYLPDANGVLHKVAHFADAQIDASKEASSGAVLVTSTPDVETYGPGNGKVGKGIYHPWDYSFYYYDLQSNIGKRVAAYLGAHGSS